MGFLYAVTVYAQADPNGKELIGQPAQEWKVTHWLNSSPLTLGSLRGKVVLVRWWTAPGCSFCAASAPTLAKLDRFYRDKELVVIGFYHHKNSSPLNPVEVEAAARQFGFHFPVAIDPEWVTLKRWWLDGRPSAWTSVSFLIDQHGIIRYVHPGGSYSEKDAQEIESMIRGLLEGYSDEG